jgi:hypothetical protein
MTERRWIGAENYAILLSVFNLSKDDIKKSTIPFLNGLLNSLSKIAELKQRFKRRWLSFAWHRHSKRRFTTATATQGGK